MFGNKKKSVPEKIITFVGDKIDGHLMGIAKNAGTVLLSVAAATVGASAVINSVRDTDDE